MAFYDKWVDAVNRRLGYVKQSDIPSRSGGNVVFAGETPVGSYNDFLRNYTEEQLEMKAFETPWLFSNISTIMNIFSEATLMVEKREGETLTPVEDHDFERRLRKPSTIPYIDAPFLWAFTAGWAIVRGEAYWLLNKDITGRLAEVIPVPAFKIDPIPSETEYISGFIYRPSGGRKPIPLKRDRVLYWRRPDLFNYHRGFRLSKVFKLPVETDTAAASWNRDTFNKGLSLQQILFLPEDLSDPLFEQAKEDLYTALYEEKKRFLAMRAGQAKSETIGSDHQKAQFVEGRKLNQEEVDRLTGFPGGFWSEKANRANSDTALEAVIRFAVWPMMVSLSAAITAQILAIYYPDEPDIEAHFKDIRPEDNEARMTKQKHEWQVKTFNEARGDIGEKPLKGEVGELIGEWPVSMATNVQFVLELMKKKEAEANPPPQPGLLSPGAQPQLPDGNQNGNGQQVDQLAGWSLQAKEDMKRWRAVALRRFRDGDDPATYHFKSDYIDWQAMEDIRDQLALSASEDEVKAVFDDYLKSIVFVPGANSEAVLPVHIDKPVLKHLRGQHDQSTHNPGRGGSQSTRVWTGKQESGTTTLTKLQSGAIGEKLVMQVLSEKYGEEFGTLNVGLNNAPIDVFGDHLAIEVKTGLSTNTMKEWRATIGEPGKAEKARLKQMTPEEKSRHNERKKQEILRRKTELLGRLSEAEGKPIKGATVGVILSPDGKRGDVYMVDDFHLRLTWSKYASDEYYLGTFDVPESAMKQVWDMAEEGVEPEQELETKGDGKLPADEAWEIFMNEFDQEVEITYQRALAILKKRKVKKAKKRETIRILESE